MKKLINTGLKIFIILVLFVSFGCDKDELPCEKVVQGDFVIVD